MIRQGSVVNVVWPVAFTLVLRIENVGGAAWAGRLILESPALVLKREEGPSLYRPCT